MRALHLIASTIIAGLLAGPTLAAPKAQRRGPIAKTNPTKNSTVMISGVPIARIGTLKDGRRYQLKGKVLHVDGEPVISGQFVLASGETLKVNRRGAYIDPAIPRKRR